MATVASVSVATDIKTQGWSAGLSRNEKELKSFIGKAEQSFKALTFQGGAGNFANAFSGIAKQAEGMATAIRSGGSAQEEFGKLVNQIPIVGPFKQAGEAIRELITGEQAALAVAKQLGDQAEKVSDGYRQIAAAASIRGTYGDQRAGQQIVNDMNSRITTEHEAIEKLNEQQNEIERHRSDIIGAGIGSKDNLTEAQHDQLAQLEREQRLHQDKIVSIRKDAVQQGIDLDKEAAERQRQFMRGEQEAAEGFEASAQEKSLRRQGKALESAIVGVQADAAARKRAEDDKITDYALRGLDDTDRLGRLRSAALTKEQIDRDSNMAIRDLQEEHQRRQEEQTKDGQEKIQEIQAQGTIAAAKAKDEALNEQYEREGSSLRSHLAEQAQIKEEHRKQVAELEKAHREDPERRNDPNDPLLKQGLQAADMEAQQKKAALAQEDSAEQRKREIEQTHELRKAWEQAGDPLEKYEAKLEDIHEQFDKLHDAKLEQAEEDKLDTDTMKDLAAQAKTPHANIDLYGRTSGYGYLPSDSNDVAAQQLAEMKKAQQQRDQTFPLFLQWLQSVTSAIGLNPVEIDISALGS